MNPTNELAEHLNDNHRRSLSIILQLIDETLCRWDEWSRGHVRSGVMYCEQDSFRAAQKAEMVSRIVALREVIERLRRDLELDVKMVRTSESN
jgi:hypothetical protein